MIIVGEFFLKGSISSLNEAIYFGASRIDEDVLNPPLLEALIELAHKLKAVVGLDSLDAILDGIDCLELAEKIKGCSGR